MLTWRFGPTWCVVCSLPPALILNLRQRDRALRWTYTRDHDGKSWTHLRFMTAVDFTKFNVELWSAFHQVCSKHELVHARLYAIAYDYPLKFTTYCRQYLGDGCFDNLVEEADDSDDSPKEDDSETAEAVEVEGQAGALPVVGVGHIM